MIPRRIKLLRSLRLILEASDEYMENEKLKIRSSAFIDASNLFYGGEKSLGWKIDYQKLLNYLQNKYGVSTAFYFGGVETHGFEYDYLNQDTVSIEGLEKYLVAFIEKKGKVLDEAMLVLVSRHLQRARFLS